jgi:hypothetical protein
VWRAWGKKKLNNCALNYLLGGVAKPLRLPGVEEQRVLDELEIDLLVAPTQQARWNRLVKERHYLRRARLVGEQCRYAVSYQGQWVALLGWSAAAWHLGPRDEWLGWSEEQRRRRLHFLAQNSRFVILADRTRYPNLGTRSMKLCLDQLSADWQAQHGHPLVALESFVDGQLFRGTLYQASNWTLLGPTAGFGRVAEDFYVRHARPKQLWVRRLHPQARAWLGAPQLPAPRQAYEQALPARWDLPLGQLGSLRERFAAVSEFRKGQGKRHRIPTVLAIAAGAKMAGVIGGYSGIASYAHNLTRPQRRALHCWFGRGDQPAFAPVPGSRAGGRPEQRNSRHPEIDRPRPDSARPDGEPGRDAHPTPDRGPNPLRQRG